MSFQQPHAALPAFAQDAASLLPVSIQASAAGHFDELRGRLSRGGDPIAALAPAWQQFLDAFGSGDGSGAGLDERTRQLQRQLADNGVTYNVHADPAHPQRPWALDLFPLLVAADDWRQIEAGVQQRVRLLDRVLADVYGPRELLARALLPAALVQGQPGYLRAMHGVELAGGTHLQIAAFDLARGPDGRWWVVSQRTQAPSGLGYLLENRLLVSRLFAPAFEALPVQQLATTYSALTAHLKRLCAQTGAVGESDAHLALLTPGPYSETWFEHAYLARYLGLTLVEGSDLTVRDQRLYLKTLRGLEPVHGLLKRLDDEYLDPLELRPDSTLGVPGLLQAVRAGNLVMANAPGSAFLESPALLGFLPALSRQLLGEELALPSLATWWCGEAAAARDILPRLASHMIKPTGPAPGGLPAFDVVRGSTLDADGLRHWADRIRAQGDEYTVQAYLPMSLLPTWQPAADGGPGQVVPRSVMLRVFAVACGAQSWRVLPGGMARIATADEEIASMQRGGSSADVWVLGDAAPDRAGALLPSRLTPELIGERRRAQRVTSRAAENLFWLGRYTERAENSTRLSRVVLEALSGEDADAPALLAWIDAMAASSGLVPRGVTPARRSRRVFERALLAALGAKDGAYSVGFNLGALRRAASQLRERLSPQQWGVITRCESEFLRRIEQAAGAGPTASLEAQRALDVVLRDLATMTGAQADRMMRDDGLRLLNAGRQIERLGFFAGALRRGFKCGSIATIGGFDGMVALFDSTITFRAQYQQAREPAALIDLLVMDQTNPRALAWVARNLRGRVEKIMAFSAAQPLGGLLDRLPDPHQWELVQLAQGDAQRGWPALDALLAQCAAAAWETSDRIGTACFSHARVPDRSVGA